MFISYVKKQILERVGGDTGSQPLFRIIRSHSKTSKDTKES
jgi:hypothetical protein